LKRMLSLIVALPLALTTLAQAATTASIRLWRLDCGMIQENDLNLYSDTYAYVGKSARLPVSCYLIQHGDTYMLWDAGLPAEDLGLPLEGPGSKGETLARTLPDQLKAIGVDAKRIEIIGISHHHFDHTGQAKLFPQARLLMGKSDIQALRATDDAESQALAHWLSGSGKLEEVTGDKDIFGDRSVVMLDLPGHTPGHHGLLIRLAQKGYVLLSGDVAHFSENYQTNGVPIFNTDRAQTLASLDRFKAIARNLRATVIIQHEAGDIGKLPAFPGSAQ
jgi:N-acyl homoserine lactone hydrolase